MRRSGPRGAGGQATVELALALPVVVVLLLLVVQVALIGRASVLVAHAAREGARSAALGHDAGAARAAARSAPGLAAERVRCSVGTVRPGRPVTVTVRYHAETDVPLVGPLLPDPVLSSSVTMLVEPDDDG